MTEKITEEFLKYRRIIASLLSKIRPAASRQDIEDILQDTYINTYQSSLKQPILFPKAFMVKTAIRLANRSIQLAQRVDSEKDVDAQSDESLFRYDMDSFSSQTEKEVLNREDFGLLCAAVDELPEQCRRVFVLKKIYGFSQREISHELGISESTVEKHVAKGLVRTMQYYDAHTQGGMSKDAGEALSLSEYKRAKQRVK